MVGGTRIHRWIHERALVEMQEKEREKILLGEKKDEPSQLVNYLCLLRALAVFRGAGFLP
jgi:hypothetical protein